MRVWPIRSQDSGLAQARLYLVRWYSLGQRPPTYLEGFMKVARQGWEAGLQRRGAAVPHV